MKPADIERIKNLLPTSLGSEEIRERIAADILRRSVFSARMESARYLAKIRDVCTALSAGTINQATARADLLRVLETMGHSPQDDGGLKNPASIRRLNLILETQRQMAASVAVLSEQTESTVWLYPAWQLTRLEDRQVPRADWSARWRAAGNACGFAGALRNAMIALKSSPIWAALGNGAGGFRDTLGNPYPPFAFSSGLDWVEVDRERAINLGLIREDEQPKLPDTGSLAPNAGDITEAEQRFGFTLDVEDPS